MAVQVFEGIVVVSVASFSGLVNQAGAVPLMRVLSLQVSLGIALVLSVQITLFPNLQDG